MKGRIIGREGRNIRAFELATGVDVIIDDTPDTVVVSCFDPVRREVARLVAREARVRRPHPSGPHRGGRQQVAQRSRDADRRDRASRRRTRAGVHGLHPELIKLIGRMRWRTSYGQNILQHSKEVAWLAGIMAAELGLDVAMARRGALLHDVGKVLTHEHEGTHVQLGVEVATRYGENPLVVNCIAAHHDDVPHESESLGARAGGRRDLRLAARRAARGVRDVREASRGPREDRVELPGVEKVFAIQAGREVRVIVTPDDVDDVRMTTLSEEIARRIEAELQYPGQIKVVLIRETRAVDFAR